MEKLCIDVRGFSVEKKMRVQDAFFELGCKWANTHAYLHLGADWYGNVYPWGNTSGGFMVGGVNMSEQQREYAITYPELMRKAGMDESDPDALPDFASKSPVYTSEISYTRDIQSVISDYLFLLDSIKDPYARGVIKSQLTDLTDLQYQQLTGEKTNA